MKRLELITLTKIFLKSSTIFLTFSHVSITKDNTVKISKKFKWFLIILLLLTNILISYYYGFLATPPKMQANPFLVLGFLRGMFTGTCSFLGVTFILFKGNHLAKIIQKLNDLQSNFKFSNKQLNIMLSVIILQLFLCYASCFSVIFTAYNSNIKMLFLRIFIALGSFIMMTPMLAGEMFFISVVGVLAEYFKMINENLNELNSSRKDLSLIW